MWIEEIKMLKQFSVLETISVSLKRGQGISRFYTGEEIQFNSIHQTQLTVQNTHNAFDKLL